VALSGISHENYAAPHDDVADAVAAVEELKAEFGLKILLLALTRSDLGASVSTDPQTTMRVVQFVLREIVYSTDPQLEAEIMAIGSGVLDEKGIMSKIAGKRGVTRQAVSKRVVAFCEQWGLPPSTAMKSAQARATYAQRNQPKI
jgi:hypothetical protein